MFALNEQTGRIEHAEYTGFCLTINGPDVETELGLLACDEGAAQQFTFDAATGEIHPAANAVTCLAGSAESDAAGPFMSRTLNIAACADTDPSLKTFVVQD